MANDPLLDGLEIAATVFCPHCHRGYYGSKSQNDLARDGLWLNGDMQTATHIIDGKRRICRARKLIPLMLVSRKRWRS